MHNTPTNLFDYREQARDKLLNSPYPAHWHYIDGASCDEITTAKNRQYLDDIELLPRVLRGGNIPATQCNLNGLTLDAPFMLAPVAYQKLAHDSGELGALHAAMAQDTGYCLSTLASTTIENIASQTDRIGKTAPLIFQLYMQPDQAITKDLIQRAEHCEYDAIMVTVDAPINGIRNREARSGFCLPDSVHAANLAPYQQQHASSLQQLMLESSTWEDLANTITDSALPVYVKGILTPADALEAKSLGAQGVVVSNHGGRILDGCVPSIRVLPAIRDAVGAEFSILFDSGIRRGGDIFKALALGANACLIGRPFMYALAVGGPMGVAHCIKLLKDELLATMSLMGCHCVEDITPDCVHIPSNHRF